MALITDIGKNKRILLIDDEPEIRETLSECLSILGGTFYEAENGVEALQMMQTEKFDVVISDFNMPKMNGLEMLKTMKERGIPLPMIIWLTGRGSPELYRQVWALGVFEYLEKPFSPAELISKVQTLLAESERSSQVGEMSFKFNCVSDVLFHEAKVLLDRGTFDELVKVSTQNELSVSSQISILIKDYLNSKRSA